MGVAQLYKRGQQLQLSGLKSSVHVSWYYFKRMRDGKKRYVLVLKLLRPAPLLGGATLKIEAFHALPNIASAVVLVNRPCWECTDGWFYPNHLLAHWAHLHSGGGILPDWGEAAHLALEMSASDGIITVAGRDSTSPTSGKKLRAGFQVLVLELRVPKSWTAVCLLLK